MNINDFIEYEELGNIKDRLFHYYEHVKMLEEEKKAKETQNKEEKEG